MKRLGAAGSIRCLAAGRVLFAVLSFLVTCPTPIFANECTMTYTCTCNTSQHQIMCKCVAPTNLPAGSPATCTTPSVCASSCGCCCTIITAPTSSSKTCSGVSCSATNCSACEALLLNYYSRFPKRLIASAGGAPYVGLLSASSSFANSFRPPGKDSATAIDPWAVTTERHQASIAADSRVPVLLVDATYDGKEGVINGFDFKVVNEGKQDLLAYIVAFDIETEDGHTTTITFSTDSYVGGLHGRPSETHSVPNLRPGLVSRVPIRSVQARVAYAEFADGQLFGPRAIETARSLDRSRRSVLAVYANILRQIRSEGANAGAENVRRILSSFSGAQRLSGQREAVEYLSAALEHRGYEGVLSELQKSERPPNR